MVNNSSLVDPVLPIHSQLQPNIQKLNLMIRYWPVNIKSIIDFEKTTVFTFRLDIPPSIVLLLAGTEEAFFQFGSSF